MRKPMLARSVILRYSLLIIPTLFLAACTSDVTAPATSRLAPSEANKALKGLGDGVYTFTVNPNRSESIPLGASHLDLPAHAICDLRSTYGPDFWNDTCREEKKAVVITAIVRHASSSKPSIEFYPALRFSPDANVQLTIGVTNAETLNNMTVMYYCSDKQPTCVDESLRDASLKTTVDKVRGLVSRRIKHFSGYVVAENADLPPILP